MDSFSAAIVADLRALADGCENNAPTDFVLFRLERLTEDLAQLASDRDLEVDVVLDRLQEAAHELQIQSVREEGEARFGRPHYILPRNN